MVERPVYTLMSMFSLRNCTEPSHNRNSTPAGWLPRKFPRLPEVASGGGLGCPLLAFPWPVRSKAMGGALTFESQVLVQVLNGLVMKAGPAPPQIWKLSVTGFLFICSIVQAITLPDSAPGKLLTYSMSLWVSSGFRINS